MTETVLLDWFATKTCVPFALTVTAVGADPTGMVWMTVFVAVLITDTVLLPRFVT